MELVEYVIAEDGVLLLKWLTPEGGVHRGSRLPGDDIADLSDEARDYIESFWTPLFIAAWREAKGYRPPTLEQAREAFGAAVTIQRDAIFEAGFSPAAGPLAGHTLQCRDVQDRTNWLASQAGYSLAVAQGHGAVAGATFRTMANETVTVTYAEGLAVIMQLWAWGQAIMQRSWALKDEGDLIEDPAAFETIDITTGWPE